MIKFIFKLCVIFSFIFASTSKATLITTELTDNNYINYNGLDIAWVSPVNYPLIGLSSLLGPNTLYAPNALHIDEGWRFASQEELDIIKSLTLDHFFHYEDSNIKYYKNAVEYWNTDYIHIDIDDFVSGRIHSDWGTSNPVNFGFETFYVRTTEVPEPSTLMVFALGLIALVSKKRLFS